MLEIATGSTDATHSTRDFRPRSFLFPRSARAERYSLTADPLRRPASTGRGSYGLGVYIRIRLRYLSPRGHAMANWFARHLGEAAVAYEPPVSSPLVPPSRLAISCCLSTSLVSFCDLSFRFCRTSVHATLLAIRIHNYYSPRCYIKYLRVG